MTLKKQPKKKATKKSAKKEIKGKIPKIIIEEIQMPDPVFGMAIMHTMSHIMEAAGENPGVLIAMQMGEIGSPSGHAYQIQLSLVPTKHDHSIEAGKIYISDEEPQKAEPKKKKAPIPMGPMGHA